MPKSKHYPKGGGREDRRRRLQSYLDQLRKKSDKTQQDVDLIQELRDELDPAKRLLKKKKRMSG